MFDIILIVFIICIIIYYLFRPIFERLFSRIVKPPNYKKYSSQIKKIDNFNNYLNDIKNSTETINDYKKERDLYELYFKGVPDVYIDNMLVKGVEPDAIKAIENLNIIIKGPLCTEMDVINLAKIYHYGMHKFEKDINKAEEIYMNIKTNDVQIRQIIREALLDINKIRTYEWLNLPMKQDKQVQDIHQVIVPIVSVPRDVAPRVITQRVITQRVITPQIIARDEKKYNDPQNTHNSQVLSTVRHSLDSLKNTPQRKTEQETLQEIQTYIHGLVESDKKRDALKSLDAVMNNQIPLSSTGMTEKDALNLVWNRINDPEYYNDESKNNAKDMLFDQLASMQEHGDTICPTGRFTHIVDTLSGIDKDVFIKPTHVILEEMMNKSSKIREDMLEASDNKQLLERGTSPDQIEFDTKLKNTIITKLEEDYVNTGILSKVKFQEEINKWINDI